MKKITKSDYITSLQCLNKSWFSFRDKSKIPSFDSNFIIDRGNEFGKLAHKLYPQGILIKSKYDAAAIDTQKALAQNIPIFEATFMTNQFYCKVDILVPSNSGWDLYEVKSSSSVKSKYYHDLAFQKMVLEKNNLIIKSYNIIHANNEYIRGEGLDLQQLFKIKNVTNNLSQASSELQNNIDVLLAYISKDLPDDKYKYCTELKNCDISEVCLSDLPKNNILYLTRIGTKKAIELIGKGYGAIKDIPEEYLTTKKQLIQKSSIINNQIHLQNSEIKQFLNSLIYPISYFDFETLAHPIPLHYGIKPNEKFPFQYSIHIFDGKNLNHKEFIEQSDKDPRENLLVSLINDLPKEGSIVVYFQGFEKSVLTYLADHFPKYKHELQSISDRIVDLIDVFTKSYYYNPIQKGSSSLKYVYPAVTGKDYSHLVIQNGLEASKQFYNKYYKNKSEIQLDSLLKYCELDTLAMHEIVVELHKILTTT